MPAEEKRARIERLAGEFTVFAEVGEKDPRALLAPYRWVQLIRDALAAGAHKAVSPGRAPGAPRARRPAAAGGAGARGAPAPTRWSAGAVPRGTLGCTAPTGSRARDSSTRSPT